MKIISIKLKKSLIPKGERLGGVLFPHRLPQPLFYNHIRGWVGVTFTTLVRPTSHNQK